MERSPGGERRGVEEWRKTVKIRHMSGFLGVVLLAAACGGFSTKRFDAAETGGEAGEVSRGGGSTAGSMNGGTGGKGGTTGGTTGGTGGSGSSECRTPADCSVADVACLQCDGFMECPRATCIGGHCGVVPPVCPVCMADADCPAPPLECVNCPDGSVSCPGPQCSGGQCLVHWSSCLGTNPCAGLGCGEGCNPCNGADCPVMELPFQCNAEGECTTGRPACMGRCAGVDDCPIPPPDCRLCNSGTCAQVDCINGACEMVCDPMPYCSTGDECPSATECRLCADGSCAVVDCFKGRCDYVCPEL